jgi:hypothetical protein
MHQAECRDEDTAPLQLASLIEFSPRTLNVECGGTHEGWQQGQTDIKNGALLPRLCVFNISVLPPSS